MMGNSMIDGRLRQDLTSVSVDESRRGMRIVVDEIGGRFTRVREELWKAFQNGTATEDQWRQACQAGWTRHRSQARSGRFSPLYVRIPIGSIDDVASRLARWSGWLFSRTAVIFWTGIIVLATGMVVGHRDQWQSSLGSLGDFFAQTSPIALGACFVATKIIHELAHAVMCRRIGSRCGTVGVLMLCGMPCPFCDVSDSVRNPSAWQRAWVMLAGIYVELIIASLATFVWISARDPAVQLHAINLMVICGISTLVFNANPLMRYDGYFVLSDWIGSVNLRSESSAAFGELLTGKRRSRRTILLSTYHLASSIYRLILMIAIAAMLLALSDRVHLRPLMAIVIILATFSMLRRFGGRMLGVIRGEQAWAKISKFRRTSLVVMTALLLGVILFVPMPRYRSAIGRVDAVESVKVFLPGDAIVESVGANFGDRVQTGQSLLSLADSSDELAQSRISGQLRVAQLQSRLSRRSTIAQRTADNRGEAETQWETFQEVERTLETQLASVKMRANRNDVRANVDGVVLPAESTISADPLRGITTLSDRVGTLAISQHSWCRISVEGQLHAVLQIDARDRNHIRIGSPVRIALASMPDRTFDSIIESVSAIDNDSESVIRRAAYVVTCPLMKVSDTEILGLLGTQCRAIVRLPARTLAEGLFQRCKDGLGG